MAEHGRETLDLYLNALLDYSERRTREDLRKLPDGAYEFTDYMDDDGFGSDLVPIHVTITKKDDGITYDYTGTSHQIPGAMNYETKTRLDSGW